MSALKSFASALTLTTLTTLVAGAGPARAAPPVSPEECWTESGNPRIVDGLFLAFVDDSQLSKEQLISTLRTFTLDVSLQPDGFPSIAADGRTLLFDLKAMNPGPDETRAQFKARIDARVHALQAMPGVEVDCEQTMVPGPAVSGSN